MTNSKHTAESGSHKIKRSEETVLDLEDSGKGTITDKEQLVAKCDLARVELNLFG